MMTKMVVMLKLKALTMIMTMINKNDCVSADCWNYSYRHDDNSSKNVILGFWGIDFCES